MVPAGPGLGGYPPRGPQAHPRPGGRGQQPQPPSSSSRSAWGDLGGGSRPLRGHSPGALMAAGAPAPPPPPRGQSPKETALGALGGARESEPTLTFFLRRRWMRAASCTVLSVSAWRAGASETWAIMVARQLAAARDSRSSVVSLCSLRALGARMPGLERGGGQASRGTRPTPPSGPHLVPGAPASPRATRPVRWCRNEEPRGWGPDVHRPGPQGHPGLPRRPPLTCGARAWLR